jgi:hypothetical protein
MSQLHNGTPEAARLSPPRTVAAKPASVAAASPPQWTGYCWAPAHPDRDQRMGVSSAGSSSVAASLSVVSSSVAPPSFAPPSNAPATARW